MSPRVLHFGSHQTSWICRETLEREDDQSNHSDNLHSLDTIAESSLRQPSEGDACSDWFDFVQDYTARDLTHQTDVFPAIRDILSALQETSKDTCFAGLWHRHFLRNLLWRIKDLRKGAYKANAWIALSWSFAAVTCGVHYPRTLRSVPFCATLVECKITPAGESLLGELKSDFMRITAPVVQLEQVSAWPLRSRMREYSMDGVGPWAKGVTQWDHQTVRC